MNSLSSLPHFELKYCERCGGLWLRPEDTATPYCPSCEHFMSDLPRRLPRRPRLPVHRAVVAATTSLAISVLANLRDVIAGCCA